MELVHEDMAKDAAVLKAAEAAVSWYAPLAEAAAEQASAEQAAASAPVSSNEQSEARAVDARHQSILTRLISRCN